MIDRQPMHFPLVSSGNNILAAINNNNNKCTHAYNIKGKFDRKIDNEHIDIL